MIPKLYSSNWAIQFLVLNISILQTLFRPCLGASQKSLLVKESLKTPFRNLFSFSLRLEGKDHPSFCFFLHSFLSYCQEANKGVGIGDKAEVGMVVQEEEEGAMEVILNKEKHPLVVSVVNKVRYLYHMEKHCLPSISEWHTRCCYNCESVFSCQILTLCKYWIYSTTLEGHGFLNNDNI